MVMAERYGIPSTKIISLMTSWQVPFRNVAYKGEILRLLLRMTFRHSPVAKKG
jgi:hypothetical protein